MRVDEMIVKPPSGRALVATFDEKDLALLLFEAIMCLKRPPHVSRDEALENIEQRHPELRDALRRAASATMEYFCDRMNAAEPEGGPLQ